MPDQRNLSVYLGELVDDVINLRLLSRSVDVCSARIVVDISYIFTKNVRCRGYAVYLKRFNIFSVLFTITPLKDGTYPRALKYR